jgi:hypothetical protein
MRRHISRGGGRGVSPVLGGELDGRRRRQDGAGGVFVRRAQMEGGAGVALGIILLRFDSCLGG